MKVAFFERVKMNENITRISRLINPAGEIRIRVNGMQKKLGSIIDLNKTQRELANIGFQVLTKMSWLSVEDLSPNDKKMLEGEYSPALKSATFSMIPGRATEIYQLTMTLMKGAKSLGQVNLIPVVIRADQKKLPEEPELLMLFNGNVYQLDEVMMAVREYLQTEGIALANLKPETEAPDELIIDDPIGINPTRETMVFIGETT